MTSAGAHAKKAGKDSVVKIKAVDSFPHTPMVPSHLCVCKLELGDCQVLPCSDKLGNGQAESSQVKYKFFGSGKRFLVLP